MPADLTPLVYPYVDVVLASHIRSAVRWGRGEEVESYAEVIVDKNKTGPTGTARLIFDSRFASFRGP